MFYLSKYKHNAIPLTWKIWQFLKAVLHMFLKNLLPCQYFMIVHDIFYFTEEILFVKGIYL